ncbi:MAG TPA: MEDS domain-containing protein [Sedimentisphaerales bacterium]|nr:MEDS domain-containing protein [Sedimentisphaerales bacterium]
MAAIVRKSGIEVIGDVPWGTHLCQFYKTKEDLIDILVPYFKAGLRNNEFCMWVTSEPLSSEEARNALAKEVNSLGEYVAKGQIEILDYTQWYTKSGRFDAQEVLQGWAKKEKQALASGFDGLRLTGNTFWLGQKDWKDFADYEAEINRVIGDYRMLAICTYSLDKCTASEIIDVVGNHEFALIRRERKWEIIESIKHRETLAALGESENKYRTLLKNVPQKIFYKDLNSAYVLCNDSFAEDLKITPKDIRGKTDYDFFPKESAEKHKADDKRIMESGNAEEIEEQYLKDGKDIAVHTFKAPVKDEQGNTIGIFGISWDITEHKHAEQALRESQKHLSTRNRIAEVFLTTRDDEMYAEVLQVILEAMQSRYGIFGYIDEDETLIIPSMTRDIWEQCQVPDKTIVYPREKWGGIWGRALKEKRTLYANEGLHVPDGHVPITRVLVVPILYGQQLIGLLEVANKPSDYAEKDRRFLEDVAAHIAPILNARLERDKQQRQRRQAEEALRRSEERYSLAQRAASIGSWDWDILTGKLTWSEQIEPMFGFGRGQFAATYEAFLECVHPDDRRHVVDSVNACVEQSRDYAIEHRIVWPDGTVRWVSEKGDVIRNETGNAIRMLGVVQDITERKTAEQRLLLGSSILETINQKEKGQDIIRRILELLKEYTHLDAVGIRLRDGDDYPYYEVNGFSEDFVNRENYLCARDESGGKARDLRGRPVLECMCGNVILGRTDPDAPFFTEGGSFWTNSTTQLLASTSDKERMTHTRNHCNRAGYESVALIPLRSGPQIVGLLQLNDHQRGCFNAETIRFFEGMGDSIGIALARIKADEQIESLARFPSESPSSIVRVAADGAILYANGPGDALLHEWGCNVGQRVPKHWHQYVSRILGHGDSEELETTCGDRILSVLIAPVVDAGYVNLYGIDITERKQAEEDLRQYRQHLEELVKERTAELQETNQKLRREVEQRKELERQLLDISEREKRLIGQELHDSIGQQLTGIAFMTKVLQQKLVSRLPEEAGGAAEISELVNEAMSQTRVLAKGLHPVDLDAESLMSALHGLASTTEHLFGVNCSFRCDKPVSVADTTVAVNLYRIAQEAVTNAVKHGKAQNIRIGLASHGGQSTLTVNNDGLDFEPVPQKGAGMGLNIMHYRAEIINGSLDIRKGASGGTQVTCTFPNDQN